MIKRLLILITFVIIILKLASCSSIYGIKKIEPINENTIINYSKKYNIPIAYSYQLDTSYITFLSSLDTTKYKEQKKNHYQPLQALYFDKTGKLKSFQINCYAGGFPNLKWNRDNIMTTFPPKQQAPLDNILTLEKQVEFLKPLSKSNNIETRGNDYFVVVYWNKFMGRQSKRLIRYVQANIKPVKDAKVKIIYVNNDNVFSMIE